MGKCDRHIINNETHIKNLTVTFKIWLAHELFFSYIITC